LQIAPPKSSDLCGMHASRTKQAADSFQTREKLRISQLNSVAHPLLKNGGAKPLCGATIKPTSKGIL